MFVFSGLVVLLDQLFKRWIVRVLPLNETMEIIPGVLDLRHVYNTGAAFGILPDQRWLLAAVSFIASLVLIFILLRYTEGFWGTLGLASVLGGAVGNLIDRVFHGQVIDMFRLVFIEDLFPFIFNIADVFITLGFITFCIHFITVTIRQSREEKEALEGADDDFDSDEDYYDDDDEDVREEYPDPYDEFERADSGEHGQYSDYQDESASDSYAVDTRPDFGDLASYIDPASDDQPGDAGEPQASSDSAPNWQEYYEPAQAEDGIPADDELDALELDLDADEDYDVDALLREYGFEDDTKD